MIESFTDIDRSSKLFNLNSLLDLSMSVKDYIAFQKGRSAPQMKGRRGACSPMPPSPASLLDTPTETNLKQLSENTLLILFI